MIIRSLFLIFVFSLQSLSTYCQCNQEKSHIYYDVDSFPTLQIDSCNDKEIVSYYITVKENVSKDIQFKGGYKSLSAFCDSLYYNREDYNYDELNARALYVILFDQFLKIKEVRILKRLAYNNLKYNYDDLIKKILFSTEGHWVKTNDNKSNWYFYLGYFNLR